MPAANQQIFDDPVQRSTHRAYASGVRGSGIRGGMTGIVEDKLRPGTVIFRIGHSTLPMTKNLSSPWWMRDESFYYLLGIAKDSGSSLEHIFRMKCAVAYDFGVADIVLQAQVKLTLRAFAGRGRPVIDEFPDKIGMCWFGAFEIAQLYIPGLRDVQSQAPSKLCRDSINLIEKFKASEYIRIRRGRIKRQRKELLRQL